MAHIRRRVSLFKIQPFRWLILSGFLATFGNGLAYIAMTWLVLQAQNSVSSVAILMISFWLPTVILSPWSGVIADKYSRQRICIITSMLRASALILFPLIFDPTLSATGIYWLAAVMGGLLGIYTPASMAIVREIVPEQDLLYANVNVDITYELGHMIGMGSAGFIISYFSASTAIILNGVFFIMATLALLLMGSSHYLKVTTLITNTSYYQDFRAGAHYLWHHKSLSMIYLIQLLLMVIFMTTPIILAPFAKNILHANVIQFGEIEAALSVGIVLGGLFIPYFAEKYGSAMVVIVGTALSGFCFLIFSMTKNILVAEGIYLLIGICLSVWAIVITKAQELTAINFQGRVQASFNAIAGIGILSVYLAIHYLGETISISYFYGLEFIIALLTTGLAWQYRKFLNKKTKTNAGLDF